MYSSGSEAPHIIVLDSLGGDQITAVNNVRNYLCLELQNNKWLGVELSDQLKTSFNEIRTIVPKKPEQDNGSDCGLFLLHYVEKIFENVHKFLSPDLFDLSTWFTMQEVGEKRGNIAALIRRLANDQGINPSFPDIKLAENSQGKLLKLFKVEIV